VACPWSSHNLGRDILRGRTQRPRETSPQSVGLSVKRTRLRVQALLEEEMSVSLGRRKPCEHG